MHPNAPNPVMLGDMNLHRPRRSCLDPMRIPVLGLKCSTCPSGCVPFLFTRLRLRTRPLHSLLRAASSLLDLSHPATAVPHPLLRSRSHSFPRGCTLLTRSLSLSLAGGQKSLRGTSVGCKPRMKGKGLLTRKEIEALRDQVGRYLEEMPTGALREVRGKSDKLTGAAPSSIIHALCKLNLLPHLSAAPIACPLASRPVLSPLPPLPPSLIQHSPSPPPPYTYNLPLPRLHRSSACTTSTGAACCPSPDSSPPATRTSTRTAR